MIKIEIKDGIAKLYTPYDADFVKEIKLIGGAKWLPQEKCWTIPENCVDIARNAMLNVYGYSDISENETITVKVVANDVLSEDKASVVIFGKTVSRAYGRDTGASVGEDVAYISGKPTSGGSKNHWMSIVEQGSEIILLNVNKKLFDKFDPELNKNITVTVVEQKEVNKNTLMAEKERLLKRIAEIDKLIEEG